MMTCTSERLDGAKCKKPVAYRVAGGMACYDHAELAERSGAAVGYVPETRTQSDRGVDDRFTEAETSRDGFLAIFTGSLPECPGCQSLDVKVSAEFLRFLRYSAGYEALLVFACQSDGCCSVHNNRAWSRAGKVYNKTIIGYQNLVVTQAQVDSGEALVMARKHLRLWWPRWSVRRWRARVGSVLSGIAGRAKKLVIRLTKKLRPAVIDG